MKRFLVIDKRAAFISDLKVRMDIDDDRDISVDSVVYSDNDAILNTITNGNYDAVIISSNILESTDFVVPINEKIFGFLEKKTTDPKILTDNNITNIGFFRNSTSFFDYLELNLDLNTAKQVQQNANLQPDIFSTNQKLKEPVESTPLATKEPVQTKSEEKKALQPELQTQNNSVQIENNTSEKPFFCSNCGMKLNNQMKFCPSCGTPVKQTQSIDNDKELSEVLQEKAIERENNQDEINKLVAEDLAPHKHTCKIITTYAAKGGVGKTTLSSELAVYLGMTCTNRRKSRVCIVDYNIDFGDVLHTLGFKRQQANMMDWTVDIENRLENGEKPEDVKYTKEQIASKLQKKIFKNGVEIYGLIAPTVHTDSMLVGEESLYIMLNNLKENGDFDYIVCDTGNNTRDSSFIALEKADNILMICTQDVTTANCNDSFLKTMEALDFDSSKISLVINNIVSAKETGISVKDIEEYVKFPCIARIRHNTEVIRANNESQPLVFNPNSQFTKEIANIVSCLVDEELTLSTTKKKSLFGRRKNKN